MRVDTRIAFAIGCISLLALIVPAFGDPAKPAIVKHVARTHAPAAKTAIKTTTKTAAKTAAKPMTKPTAARHLAKNAAPARDANRLTSTPVAEPLQQPRSGWPALVREARKYMGTNPTARKKLWCATFMNFVLAKAGYAGTNSDAAKSFAYYGHRITSPQVGAIAVLSRGKTGGHVGVVTGIDANGNPIIISGNHGHRVGEGTYPRSRVIAYVMPSESRSLTQVADRSAVSAAVASGSNFDSPISELIAAIEAEQNRPDTPRPQRVRAADSTSARAPASFRAGEAPGRAGEPAAPQTPHRIVQEKQDQLDDAASIDATVADLFRLRDRAATPVPPQPVPQRQLRPQQRAGHVAAADAAAR
jgi:uncharacterized protein (TIGR02594 family)